MDPNSQHQLWSHWIFTVREAGRCSPRADVELNVARWLRMGFGSAGTIKVTRTVPGWRIDVLVEGPPAHDPAYVDSVRRQFQKNFVEKGWGPMASSDITVRVLAGDKQNGSPRDQMILMPSLRVGVRSWSS